MDWTIYAISPDDNAMFLFNIYIAEEMQPEPDKPMMCEECACFILGEHNMGQCEYEPNRYRHKSYHCVLEKYIAERDKANGRGK